MLELIFELQREFQALKDSLSAAEAELAVFRKYNVYQHGKIYKIVNTVDKKVYIGCTTLPLVERFAIHRKKTGTGTMKIHQHMKKHGRDKFSIHLVKEVPTYSRWHLETEEYNVQLTIPEEHRIFTLRPRIPFGLGFAEKNAHYSKRWYQASKARKSQLRLANAVAASDDSSPSLQSSE